MTVTLNTTADLDLRQWIKPGDGVVWGQASAEPTALTALLSAQAPSIGQISCFLGSTSASAFQPHENTALTAYCAGGRNRLWVAEHGLTVLPVHYSALPRLLGSVIASDVVMLLLPLPDATGRFRLGLADEYLSAAIDAARVVIAEVSPHVPFIPDGRIVEAARIDVIVRTESTPSHVLQGEPTPVERQVADQVAALVQDGATIQVGLGSLPGAILNGLSRHNDLGIHSGLIGDSVADLVRDGVVTNSEKVVDRGITVTGVVMGTTTVFDFVDHNPRVALRPTEYTHDPRVLSSQPRLTTINSAIEIDLTGQINTEVAGGRYVGAVGGALDFLRGSHRSIGGLPLTAMTSTTQHGHSRIVSRLSGPATVPRADAGVIVTEHGHVDLRGRTIADRRQMLISIAHPHVRDELRGAPFDAHL